MGGKMIERGYGGRAARGEVYEMTPIQGSTICPDPEQLKQFNYPLAVTGLKLQLANMLVLDIISLHRESTRPLLHSLAKGKPRCLSWHTISRKEGGGLFMNGTGAIETIQD